MKLNRIYFITLAAIAICCLSSCLKKGENDPDISFVSRKARVVGKWKIQSGTDVVSGNNVFDSQGGRFDKRITTYSNNSYEQRTEMPNNTRVETGSLSYEMEFKDDGSYTSTSIYDNVNTNILKRTWNFTSNVANIITKNN
ncbi:hypothetical protein [Aurantibacillus circumpalustris]|uniref:hypothetical protein n=1 Tax=Aurantibacillus circumpalustris TaxID=3036359 RepID=UPI00295AAAB2|nr:hypothetical protein [Aurantibacillus circumpalustris]